MFNYRLCIHDRYMFFLNLRQKLIYGDHIFEFIYYFHPITVTTKTPSFYSFFVFEKLEIFLNTFFDVKQDMNTFFSYQQGVNYNCPLQTLLKRRSWQKFWVSTNYPPNDAPCRDKFMYTCFLNIESWKQYFVTKFCQNTNKGT